MRTEARDAAYVEFVTVRQHDLRRMAYATCGDWDRADDLLQTALTKLYVAWPRVERDGTEEAYVRRLLLPSTRAGSPELSEHLASPEPFEAAFGDVPPARPVTDRLAAGRRVVRRRRRAALTSTLAVLTAAAIAPVLLRPAEGSGGGGGGGGGYTPPPAPTTTAPPTPVHLLVAPPSDVSADSPPVVYLAGRMFKRDRDVTVLATFGDVDHSDHPRGAAIVRVDGATSWVLVVGNEPERLTEQRAAPYDYNAFMTWAFAKFLPTSGHLALAATAPGPYAPPVLDADSPGVFKGGVLVAKPGGTVVQRDRHPVHDPNAVRRCDAQAVRINTGSGDWFVLGDDCPNAGVLYSEPVGVRADTLTSWLTLVKKAQNAYVH